MALAFHVCRHEATDVATTNNGVGRHLATIESTHFYKSLPVKRESIDTVSMTSEACTGASARIDPRRGDSHNLRQSASTGGFLAVLGHQRLNPEKPKAQLRSVSRPYFS